MSHTSYEAVHDSKILIHVDASDADSLFSDDGGTASAVDGGAVNAVSQQSLATIAGLLTSTSGPTYRADYATTGLAALEFDGTDDILSISDAGIPSTGMLAVAAFTWVGAANTLFCVGSSSAWIRGYSSATVDNIQSSTGAFLGASGITTGRRVSARIAKTGLTQTDSLGFSGGNRTTAVPASLNSVLTLGALNTGSLSQFGNFALHEFMLIDPSIEWGQAVRIATVMRNRWGITDPSPLPVHSSVSAGFTGIRGMSQRLGT